MLSDLRFGLRLSAHSVSEWTSDASSVADRDDRQQPLMESVCDNGLVKDIHMPEGARASEDRGAWLKADGDALYVDTEGSLSAKRMLTCYNGTGAASNSHTQSSEAFERGC